MRSRIVVETLLRHSEEDRRALKALESVFPAEYRAAKYEVMAVVAVDAPTSMGALAAILFQRGDADGVRLTGRIEDALRTDITTLMQASNILYFQNGKVVDVW